MSRKYFKTIFLLLLLSFLFCAFNTLSPAQAKAAGSEIKQASEAPKKGINKQIALKGAKRGIIWAGKRAVKVKEAARKDEYVRKKILQTIIIIFIGYILILFFVWLINRRIKDLRLKHLFRKNVVYLIYFLMIIFIAFLWAQSISSLTIFLSIMGAGVALALQETILCVAGWLLIVIRRPFEIGDRIEIGGVKGDVIDIRLFQTSLLEIGNWVDADQSTGRIVNVPNSAIFKKENYNYNRGFEYIWNEFKVQITFESDWKRAEEILLKHAQRVAEGTEPIVQKRIKAMTKKYMIFYEKLTPIVYANIKDSGIELTLRYLTEARKRRSTRDSISRAVLEEFTRENTINFAYPTYRIVK